MENFDYIVIGAGAMGSAAAYHLAREKRSVLLLEQFELGHTHGSSHGESRIFRFAYPDKNYSRFAIQSKPLWNQLEADSGESLLLTTGGLDVADDPTGFADVREVAATLQSLNASYEMMDRARFAARFPQFELGPDGIGLYSPDAGILFATKCVLTAIHTARKLGAAVNEHERVTALHADAGNGVDVITDKAQYHAGKVIITAGTWVNRLIKDIDLQLPIAVEKEQVVYFNTRGNKSLQPGAWPIWLHYRTEHVYGFPDLGNGLKAGFHHAGNYIDSPDQNDGVPRAGDLQRMSNYMNRYIPGVDPTPRDPLVCLYANTPDHDFIIDIAPNLPNVIIGSPCSGHGFKFAIGVGKALADLAQYGETEMSIAHVRKLTLKT